MSVYRARSRITIIEFETSPLDSLFGPGAEELLEALKSLDGTEHDSIKDLEQAFETKGFRMSLISSSGNRRVTSAYVYMSSSLVGDITLEICMINITNVIVPNL